MNRCYQIPSSSPSRITTFILTGIIKLVIVVTGWRQELERLIQASFVTKEKEHKCCNDGVRHLLLMLSVVVMAVTVTAVEEVMIVWMEVTVVVIVLIIKR